MLALAFALVAAAPLPPGTIVAGVSRAPVGEESTHTDVTAFLPDGTSRVLFSEDHAPGFVPEGSLDAHGARAALAVQQDGAEGASVVVLDLATNARTVVGQRAIRMQAPAIDGDVVTWVRAAESPQRSTFDVVSARADGAAGAGEEVLASIEGAWLSPLPLMTRTQTWLHIASDGAHAIVTLAGSSLEVTRALGKGRYRVPALAAARMLVERGLPADRAEIVDERGVVVRTGLAGMEPIAVRARDTAARFVMGAGTKRAALVVVEGARERTIDLGRAGVATPRAAALVDGGLVAVAWLDRGRSLPGELVLVDARGPRVLVRGGAHVEVYGIVPDHASQGANEANDDNDDDARGAP